MMKWIIISIGLLFALTAQAAEPFFVRIASEHKNIRLRVKNFCGQPEVILQGRRYVTVDIKHRWRKFNMLMVGRLCPTDMRDAILKGYMVCRRLDKPVFVSFTAEADNWVECMNDRAYRYKLVRFFVNR